MLSQFGPDLLVRCESALAMSRELVRGWLARYMFNGQSDCDARADGVSTWLADQANFKSHSRHLPRDELASHGLVIQNLEADSRLQDLSLSVFHSTTHTFALSPAVKIVENHLGRAFVKFWPPPPANVVPPANIPGGQ